MVHHRDFDPTQMTATEGELRPSVVAHAARSGVKYTGR
jgi:hypothetical protein